MKPLPKRKRDVRVDSDSAAQDARAPMTTDRELSKTVVLPRLERLAQQRAVREYLAIELPERDAVDLSALVERHLRILRTEGN